MLATIREFFDKHIQQSPTEDDGRRHDALHVATAALLVEMMRMSGETTEAERERVLHALRAKFALDSDDITELMRLAEDEVRQATDYYQFTSLIKNRFNAVEKERLIEHLWAIAYADGELHRYEEHLLRKIADLIYVPHKTFIAAKLRVRDQQK